MVGASTGRESTLKAWGDGGGRGGDVSTVQSRYIAEQSVAAAGIRAERRDGACTGRGVTGAERSGGSGVAGAARVPGGREGGRERSGAAGAERAGW